MSTNNEGESPFDVARSSNHTEIVDYFKSLSQSAAGTESGELINFVDYT